MEAERKVGHWADPASDDEDAVSIDGAAPARADHHS